MNNDTHFDDSIITEANYPPAETEKYQPLGWMPLDRYKALVRNIASAGRINVPIFEDKDGETIDGHHRKLARKHLRDAGVVIEKPCIITLSGLDDEGKRLYALEMNLVRRQMTPKEKRAIISAELRRAHDMADAWLADICGVSDKTVTSVRQELEGKSEIPRCEHRRRRNGTTYKVSFIFSKDSKETKRVRDRLEQLGDADLPSGSVTVQSLERILRDQKRKEIEAAPREAVSTQDIRMLHSDFRDLEIEDNHLPLILTDPPYDKESLPLWADLAEFAAQKLRPGGVLAAYSGLVYIPTVIEMLTKHLKYIHICALMKMGGSTFLPSINGRGGWRPLLLFSKRDFTPAPGKGLNDVCTLGGREKDYHDWQQPLSEAEYYIQKLSAPGDLVCDPFGGSFTAAIACYRLDRRFVGCDLDEGNVKIGYHRLAEEEEKRREAEETASQTAEEAPSVDDLAAEPVTHSEVEKLFYIEYPTIETVNVIGETERTYVIVYLDSGDEQRVSKSEVGTDWFVDEQSAQQELRKMLADEITEHQEEKDKLQEQLVAVGGVNPSSDVGAEGDMALLDNVVIAQNFARMLGGFDAFRLACECAEELTAAELADSEWIDSQSV